MQSIKRKICIRSTKSFHPKLVTDEIHPHIHEQTLTAQAFAAQALVAINDGIVISNPNLPDHPVIFANAGFTRTTGYSVDEVVGKNCRLLQGPNTEQASLDEIRQAVAESRAAHVVLTNYKKDGTPFYNELTLSPIRNNNDPNGRILYWVGVQKDITEKRRLEESYRAAEKEANDLNSRLASIVEIMSVGFMSLDGRSRVIYMNPHGEAMLGVSNASILNTHLWDVFHQPVGSIFWQQYNIARQKRTETSFEAIYEPLGIWLDVRIVPSKEGISVFFRDVTEQYRLKEERLSVRAEKALVRQEAAKHERQMLQKVIFSVTGGKLRLCESIDELPAPLSPDKGAFAPIQLNSLSKLADLRQVVRQACEICGFPPSRMYDLIIAAGECASNALQHGLGENGKAYARISIDEKHSVVQVRVTDEGNGISLAELPQRTLLHRHGGAGTSGHGLNMMLTTSDHLWILTGNEGTTVVLEQECDEPGPSASPAQPLPLVSLEKV